MLFCSPFYHDRGFCKHRGPDFGPWHRAYMKMFEDALIKACYAVAERFTDSRVRDEYMGVAETCRLPYWDCECTSLAAGDDSDDNDDDLTAYNAHY